jgi:hypothetical protein
MCPAAGAADQTGAGFRPRYGPTPLERQHGVGGGRRRSAHFRARTRHTAAEVVRRAGAEADLCQVQWLP